MGIFSIFTIFSIILSAVFIIILVCVVLYYGNSNLKLIFKRRQRNQINDFSENEETKNLKEDEDKEKKLKALTKFNTTVNRIMSEPFSSYVINNYKRIFGDIVGTQVLMENFNNKDKEENINVKKNSKKKKVCFKKKLEEIEEEF